jgi:hypothetical protein
MENKKETPKGCIIVIFVAIIIGFWGVKSWMGGNGFMAGIEGNFAVLPIIIVIAVIVFAFISISNK